MLNIGCHLSTSKGFKNMGKEALSIGANTFQFFTRNPRGGKAKDIDAKDVNELLEIMKKNNFATILAHAPYTLNGCSADENTRKFAIEMMADDLVRMEYLPNNFYNFHPGSHVKQGVDIGIDFIAQMLNTVLKPEQTTTVLLETMAGKGTEIGRSFEEIAQIIEKVELKDHLGVCLDTCHIYDAGYDIVNDLDGFLEENDAMIKARYLAKEYMEEKEISKKEEIEKMIQQYDIVNDLDGVLEEFDKIIGIDKLKAIHLNDSKNPFNSHKDRHEKIGEGSLGLKAISNIINHPKLKHLPFFLETPNELDGYKNEIEILRKEYIE